MAKREAEDSVPDRIKGLIEKEISAFATQEISARRTLEAFRAALREPDEVTVNFSGGITRTCWSVTQSDGCYRVVFMPSAGYFSLCVDSGFGPLDIGVHGDAIGCFGSV